MWGAGPIGRPEQLPPALEEAFNHVVAGDAPALVDVTCQPR